MKRWLPFPWLWVSLVAMWLALNQTLDVAHVVLAALVALAAVHGFAALQPPRTRLRRPLVAVELLWLVFVDIVRSNAAVAWIVLYPGTRVRTAGFVDIPLDLRNQIGLAALACIITATPGTAWAGYDPRSGMLTIHILDLVDEDAWRDTVKSRYERRLIAIFGDR
jgi:multicomponent K+:H+ antiporter subunit E